LRKAASVVIGIETALEQNRNIQLLKDVGSAAIKSYFNFSNALKNNRDLHKELKTLGSKYIVQIIVPTMMAYGCRIIRGLICTR
jgi:hypothetical protein